ncbi:hypothetical protein PR202_gb07417 [Eleusine coracana subsp. coracana]|uniref:Uncharacterized protein n=1 Tax=Eleusine coracana subsp. coracana TaxID=191504 RepID=A0AAV5EC66_ELECO|nr:hypothetical protein QOZ80_2BG0170010 [Eleusine coracana subsp. coracana]GJN20089.1 hypothetical protein PR202_gb07417 [Eleusine coracana subsp. coracana]
MAGVFSSKMAAPLALLVVFVACVSYAEAAAGGWLPAKATWYGSPNGAGPDDNGGACGFKNANKYPYMSMTSCGNQPLFKDGAGCGSCYQIRCLNSSHPACSGKANRIIITDMNYYPVAKYHFDLSGTAFGAMAKPGLNDKLRHAGIIDMEFRRVPCNYKGLNVTFHVEIGSNPNYFAVLVEYAGKDGAVVQTDIMESNKGEGTPTGVWTPMKRSWGAVWRMDSDRPLQAPFSLRIRSDSGKTLVANKVIPANWKPMTKYSSNVQFPA